MTDQDRQKLLAVARAAIQAHLQPGGSSRYEESGDDMLRGGAFVTLRHRGELRGCIGYPTGDQPLAEVVARCAVASALDDPRFLPVSPSELDEIEIEISVLGPIEPIVGPEEIEIGRHGLIVEQGRLRGLLLPQVAIEWSWDRETFLAQTCIKAGLPIHAWKSDAQLFRFEAEVFGEERRIG